MKDRRYPIGAEIVGRHANFRVWAPDQAKLTLQIEGYPDDLPMERDAAGYFTIEVDRLKEPLFYRFGTEGGHFPDPISRFQPEGPHGPSQIIDASLFAWTDRDWPGVPPTGQVIYELHVGTFTREGSWEAARLQLPHLAALGITVIELMPIADFPGRYGWGYDGVNLFAPTRLYGSPDQLRAFINEAHQLGIGVILDVVYNHIGPDGNYLKVFAKDYFTSKYENEWGEAINFDGSNCQGVREFFITNAVYWVEEFHFDGLRLDATQQIFDSSPSHILADLSAALRKAAGKRQIYLIAENEPQDTRLLRTTADGGLGIDSAWNDDFHHAAIVALTGKNEAYYSDYRGTAQEFVSMAKYGYLYQGQWYSWQKKTRGTSTQDLPSFKFVSFIQNHDQIANSLRGRRIHEISNPGAYRAMTTLLLLGPATPMLFQGQEFASSAPFLYFADHNLELAAKVAEGRRIFLSQFPSLAQPGIDQALHDPEREETFRRCKLDFSEVERHHSAYSLHRDLIALRTSDPVIHGADRLGIDGAILEAETFVLRYFGHAGDDRLLFFNFGPRIALHILPEPLLAPPADCEWSALWNSETVEYGGEGMAPLSVQGPCQIPAHAAVILKANRIHE